MPSDETEASFRDLVREWLSEPELLPYSLHTIDYSDFCFWLSLKDHVSELHDLKSRIGETELVRVFGEEVADKITG